MLGIRHSAHTPMNLYQGCHQQSTASTSIVLVKGYADMGSSLQGDVSAATWLPTSSRLQCPTTVRGSHSCGSSSTGVSCHLGIYLQQVYEDAGSEVQID
jgi:hypothetical protein